MGWNNIQSTHLSPQSQTRTADKSTSQDFDEMGFSQAESVHTATAASLDPAPALGAEERGPAWKPVRQTTHHARRGGLLIHW
mmetsp:Transcript_76614/g.135312  ORF Transcript_76614/g.135312 Transcript_76614/m.135312 type:complete len:82 (-) Transcript_76614:51-296(-)